MMPKKKKASQQKVDLTESPAQGGGARRRESAQSESSFGTDELFDYDPQATHQGAATPNPERRRPTIKGMKHKFVKTVAEKFGRSKGSSSSTTPSDDTSGARGSNSGTELIPSISLSPVNTHKASPRSPTSSDGLWTDLSVATSPLADTLLSPRNDDATVSSPGLDEEDITVGSREFTTTSKEEQASRMERAAQRARESGSVGAAKQLPQINRLKEQVNDLKEKLKAKNGEVQTKLDQIDIEHQDIEQQLKTAHQEIDELKKTSDAQLKAHKEEMTQKDIELNKASVLSQQVKRLQEESEKLVKQTQAKREEPSQQQIDANTQQLTEQWKAITQSHKDEHEQKIQQLEETHSDEITKLTREHQEEIKKAKSDCRDQLEKSIREELEKEIRGEYEQRRDEDIRKATTEESKRWQALNQQLKDKHEQKLNQIRDDHIKALAKTTQKHEEDVAALREQARTLELKNGDYVGEVIEHGSPSTSPEQGKHARKMDQPHQMIANIDLEKDHLKTELAAQQQRVRDLQHELDHQKEQYGQLEIQAIAKQQSFLSLSPTEGDELLVDQQDNRTDAEKLRDELEEVTKKAEQDAVTHRQETEDLQTQVKDLTQRLNDLTQRLNDVTTSNVEFQEAIQIAIEQAPPSADGIQAGDEGDSAKLLQQIRGKYLENVTEIVDLKQKHQAEKVCLEQRFHRKISELTEKIHEKNRQLKAQRDNRCKVSLPPTSSVGDDDEDEESTSIAELKAALRTKDKEVQSLSIQLQTFQQVASQRQQLQEHSKAQSTIVVQLKKELAAAQEELRVVRDVSEAAKKIGELHQKVIECNEELRDLKKLKTDVEDDLNILKQKCEAEQRNHNSVKRDLAKSQSVVSSLKDKSIHQMGAEEDPQEIQILTAEVNLYKIEVKEHEKRVERLNNRITELGKANLSLKRRLRESNEERDVLALQNVELRASKHIYKGQLEKSRKCKVDVTQEHLTHLANTIVSKTEENEQLQQKIKDLKEELELIKLQAFTYKQDFEEERAARAQAAGKNDTLSNELRKYMAEAETEKQEKQAVIAKLETNVIEKQQIAKQITQSEKDFDRTLATNLQEIEKIREEKTQFMAQMEHFRTESSKLQRQLQTAEATYERREAELVQEADELKDEVAKTQDKVQMASAMNISLNEQLESVTQDRDSKLKKLEILANKKVSVDDQLTRERNHSAALAQDLAAKEQELSHTKQNGNRKAEELQDARQGLEVSLADSAKLRDEVMAKTAQVKQYKKQTDSFKAKVEEANTKLLKTQQELQRRLELIKTMEEDNQYQIEQAKATAESNKLAAEMDLIQSQRRVEAFERELQELRNGGEIPEVVRIEVDRRIEVEQKLLVAESKCSELMDKCSELMDKCNTRYQAIEKLKGALAQHSIAIPAFSIDKIEKIPVLPHQSSNSRLDSPQHQQPVSPVTRDSQLGQQQRDGYTRAGYKQRQGPSNPAFNTNQPIRRSTEPQNSIPPHSHVQIITPRVQEDGAQYWEGQRAREGNHQIPPTSQAQLPAQNRMDTGPPIRASDPGTQHNMDQHYQGQQNQQMTSDPQQQPMYQYEQGGQQNQPIQWQGGYPNQQGGYDPNQQGGHNPNQQGGFNQDPRLNQQLQQGYAQGGPSFNHHGQQHHRGHHPPPRSPNYQPQAQNYPPTSYPQGNPSPSYHQHEVNQSQQPPRGMPQSQAQFTPQNPVQPQQMVSHQESPPTGRGQPAPEVQPTPLPRRNSKENLLNAPRPKQSSSVQENILLQGIDRDIKDAAKFVIHEGDESESMGPNAPFDPNLICPLCMRNFRVGEIQKYRKHVNTCQG